MGPVLARLLEKAIQPVISEDTRATEMKYEYAIRQLNNAQAYFYVIKNKDAVIRV